MDEYKTLQSKQLYDWKKMLLYLFGNTKKMYKTNVNTYKNGILKLYIIYNKDKIFRK